MYRLYNTIVLKPSASFYVIRDHMTITMTYVTNI